MPILTINEVCHRYNGKPVLNQVNLTVYSGEAVGIVGVSGGGKSTLLKLVSGLYELQSGEIQIFNAKSAAERRRLVAMVMQNPSLFPSSIRDNITCGHSMKESDILRVCEAAQLSEWIQRLPKGLDSDVGERGGQVSGGQAQRIAIARAMAKNAPVILLDEPTSALDKDTGAAVLDALARLTKGKTTLHVSHRPEALTHCDHVLRLTDGRLYNL